MADMVIGKIYRTDNYKKFKFLEGNREVLDIRVNKIMSSIRKRGYIKSPILVNEKFEIIDGQGRFESCKRMGLPIEYIVEKGLNIDDCIAMNINSTNWKMIDYIKSYAERGNSDYMNLYRMIKQHPQMNHSVITSVMSGSYNCHGSSNVVNSGNYKIKAFEKGTKTLEFLENILPHCKRRTVLVAFAFASNVKGVDKSRLIKVAETHAEYIDVNLEIKYILARIKEKYNLRLRAKDKMYFDTELEKWNALRGESE